MVFISYDVGTKGYRVYDTISKKLHTSRDVIFEESRAWDWKQEARADPVTAVFVEQYTVAGQGTVTENADGIAVANEDSADVLGLVKDHPPKVSGQSTPTQVLYQMNQHLLGVPLHRQLNLQHH